MKLSPLTWLAKQLAKEILMTPEIQKAFDAIDAAKTEAVKVIGKIGELKDMIADLQAQVAAGSSVTQADLVALSAKADELTASEADLDAAVA